MPCPPGLFSAAVPFKEEVMGSNLWLSTGHRLWSRRTAVADGNRRLTRFLQRSEHHDLRPPSQRPHWQRRDPPRRSRSAMNAASASSSSRGTGTPQVRRLTRACWSASSRRTAKVPRCGRVPLRKKRSTFRRSPTPRARDFGGTSVSARRTLPLRTHGINAGSKIGFQAQTQPHPIRPSSTRDHCCHA